MDLTEIEWEGVGSIPLAVSCGHSNKPGSSIKYLKFIERLGKFWFLKDSAARSWLVSYFFGYLGWSAWYCWLTVNSILPNVLQQKPESFGRELTKSLFITIVQFENILIPSAQCFLGTTAITGNSVFRTRNISPDSPNPENSPNVCSLKALALKPVQISCGLTIYRAKSILK